MRDGQGVEVSVAKEEQACGQAEGEGDHSEDRAGQVRDGEDGCGGERGEAGAGQKTAETAEEEVLQEKLLDEGPEGVSPVAFEEGDGAVHGMQGVEVDS